jgi:hypothetical protein
MKVVRVIFLTHILIFSLFQSDISYAGPFSDDLSRCIVKSTKNDRKVLVKWMFSVMSSHPAMKPMASVSEEQREEADKQIAELFMKLLTKSCKKQAQRAIKHEGQIAFQSSFSILGQLAMKDIFSNPDVDAAGSVFEKYIDEEKLESSLGIK